MSVTETTLISVVVPCYQSEKTLAEAVESLLCQKGGKRPWQIVLVDDGSTDGTPSLCDRYERENENIRTVHRENGGLVAAWKSGVQAADGCYIVFCDADDYVDEDLNARIEQEILQTQSDLILYGYVIEYNNGERVLQDNRLADGQYGKEEIEKQLLPQFFSDGSMESELMRGSRCSKAFRKEILCRIMPQIPDKISVGEDDLTTFLAVLNAEKITVCKDYYPYHYVRNEDSMIGAYDMQLFDKLDLLYDCIGNAADLYGYPYRDQIRAGQLSTMLLYMKKEICRNPYGYQNIRRKLQEVCTSDAFLRCASECVIEHYKPTHRMFAGLMIHHWYGVAYLLTKTADRLRGRNV